MEVNDLSLIPLQATDAILLDLDNTLYDYGTCHDYALQNLIEKMSLHFGLSTGELKILYDSCRRNIHHRLYGTAASHSRFFYIQEMTETITRTTNTGLINLFYNIYWDRFIGRLNLFPDVLPFLEAIMERNIVNILVTDMTAEIQFKKIQKLGIEKYLSFVVTSEEAGVEKPHPYIFERAVIKAGRLKSPIRNILLIGDDKKKDIFLPEAYSVDIYNVIR